jgi:hypothetical protein
MLDHAAVFSAAISVFQEQNGMPVDAGFPE